MIPLSTISVIRHRSGLLISMLEKLNWSCLKTGFAIDVKMYGSALEEK